MEKRELRTALFFIIVYVIAMSIADSLSAKIGIEKSVTALTAIIFSVGIFFFIRKQQPISEFGFAAVKNQLGSYLYFIPLAVIASVNLWNGVRMNFSVGETVLYIISMVCVGFLEEVIFRGFLFTALCRKNIRTAIVISSLTFGIGHIVNLLNGAEVLGTLLQICYATAVGFLFTIIFYKSGSLVPCIITHSVINSLSVFGIEGDSSFRIGVSALLTVISAAYAIWIIKKIPGAAEKFSKENVISLGTSIN